MTLYKITENDRRIPANSQRSLPLLSQGRGGLSVAEQKGPQDNLLRRRALHPFREIKDP